jgi:hypothetical protein
VILQLNPPIPLETAKGAGWAHLVIDYGPESALLWVVFMDADGACWTVPNADVRMGWNWTMGRRKPEDRKSEDRKLEDLEAASRQQGGVAPSPLRPSLATVSEK